MRAVPIGTREVGDGERTFVIAEGGVNHLGRRDLAVEMVRGAARAGADAIKFQTCRPADFLPKASPDYNEYMRTTLSEDDYRVVLAAAADEEIIFFSTALDETSADMLDRLGAPAFKVASSDLTHLPLLRHLAFKGKPILLSTGMATLGEVEQALDAIRTAGGPPVALLHCVSNYPADPEDMSLAAIGTLRQAFLLPVGLSDHTQGLSVPFAAVALGACIIEKHFTLDRSLPGADHQFSCDLADLANLVRGIREVERAIGETRKWPTPSEMAGRTALRRILVAARPMIPGEVLRREYVLFLRPDIARHNVDRAIPASEWHRVEGRRLTTRIEQGDAMSWDDLS